MNTKRTYNHKSSMLIHNWSVDNRKVSHPSG